MNIKHLLSARSDFSMGESTLQIDKLVEKAKELGYETIALVDNMTISNMVAFSDKAKKAGIKSIIGCSIRVVDDPLYRKPAKATGIAEVPNLLYTLKIYVQTDEGFRSLMKLLSKGNSPEYFYYHSRVGLEDVLQLTGCAISTGDFYGLFHHPRYDEIFYRLTQVHGANLWAEYVPGTTPLHRTLNKRAAEVAAKYEMPTIGTWPALYATPDDADSLDVLRAIIGKNKMTDRWLNKPYTRDYCIKPPLDIIKALRDEALPVKAIIDGNQALVDSCTYAFKKLEPSMPKMAEDEFKALCAEVGEGWKLRFKAPVLGHQPLDTDLPVYKARLAYELGVLRSMGFSGYFLLVSHIVNWAKANDILVGPGRGSVGGSLVAYLMGITDVDPIRFGLLFERFINPERLDLPDADLDFMSKRRVEVLDYIADHFGRENVAGVSNYNTMGAAGVMRDTSRVHDLSPFDYACSKQMEKQHGVSVGLEESAAVVPEIDKFKGAYPTIWKHMINLEGAARGLGQHAAGVVVAGEPIINRAVVETRTGGPVCNWDKRVVEDFGLIKMDILGLTTLDVLRLAITYIKERHGKTIDLLRVPLDDKRVLASFGRGDTTGIFQYESGGMRRLLREMALSGDICFDDLVAVTALYRPGPLDAGLCDEYVAIKQGSKSVSYDHWSVEAALKDTFGIMVYQEQVMQVSRDLSGFTLAEADGLRKAIGKKDLEKMKEQRARFVEGAVAGYCNVTLDDGRSVKIHRSRRLKIVGSTDRFTVEQVMANGYEIAEAI
jgi:DNA polymerase-3 subunit alpha